jgi:hypothetical protein
MPRIVNSLPSTDRAFGEAASNALAGIDGHVGLDEIETVLADLLRPTYPKVQVHRQDPLAQLFDEQVWYAYRDGKPLGQIGDPVS